MGRHLTVALVSLLLAPPVAGNETLPVAAIFALSGRGASSNVRHLRGAELAVAEINRKGGLLGRKIELVVLDNESTGVGSARAAEEAVKRGVMAIIGASWSDHSLAIAPIAQKAGVPMITNYSTNPKVTQTGDFIFRVCYLDTFQAAVMARFAHENLRLRRVAILYESGNEYSSGLADFFEEEFRRRGGAVPLKRAYMKDSLDYAEFLEAVRRAQVDAVYLPAYEKEAGLILRQAYKVGLDVPFLGSDSWADTLPKYLGGPVRIGYDVKPWNPDSPHPLSRNFVRAYRSRYGAYESILSGSALAYDAVLLLGDAIRRAGSLDRRKIRGALAATQDFVGVTGRIRFDENRNPIKGAVINRYRNSAEPRYYVTIQP